MRYLSSYLKGLRTYVWVPATKGTDRPDHEGPTCSPRACSPDQGRGPIPRATSPSQVALERLAVLSVVARWADETEAATGWGVPRLIGTPQMTAPPRTCPHSGGHPVHAEAAAHTPGEEGGSQPGDDHRDLPCRTLSATLPRACPVTL
jgi:hypothetical protein